MICVCVWLLNVDYMFMLGLYVCVQFVSGCDQDVLLVDDKVVLIDQDCKYVYVIGFGDKVLCCDVMIGCEFDGEWIVEKGLQLGDCVVVDGVQCIYYLGVQVKLKVLFVCVDVGNVMQVFVDVGVFVV